MATQDMQHPHRGRGIFNLRPSQWGVYFPLLWISEKPLITQELSRCTREIQSHFFVRQDSPKGLSEFTEPVARGRISSKFGKVKPDLFLWQI
ncbi:MAG: hypothetical protein ACI83D_000366 [Planctomycetota bacterium]|jgi:hypothetical protein